MASTQAEQSIAGEAARYYLLLLTSPLDTNEAIHEVLEPGTDYDPATTRHSWQEVFDTKISAQHLGVEGKAVLLDRLQAEKVVDYANRHRAVYQMKMVPLDDKQFREANISSMGLSFPLWLFRRHNGVDAHLAELEQRPSRLTGFEDKWEENYSPRVTFKRTDLKIITRDSHPRSTQTSGLRPDIARSKLRPAHDVMNRLRHDDSFNMDDYWVVYQDRFAGEISVDLASWRSDVSEEEFIPQHRILRFERKWDGVTLWDRQRKFDFVFGTADATEWNIAMGLAIREIQGWAIKVESVKQLVQIVGIETAEDWNQIKRAQFEFTDGDGGTCKGIAA